MNIEKIFNINQQHYRDKIIIITLLSHECLQILIEKKETIQKKV